MTKKLILLLLLLSSIYAQTAVAPTAGDGSESNPYQIATLENLYWITADSLNWDKHYIQIADINMSDCWNWEDSIWTGYEDYYDYYCGWIPIGDPFTGSYDGQFYTIDSLKINFVTYGINVNDRGLFGKCVNGSISNLCLTNVNIYNIQSINAVNHGSLVGYCDSSIISNCFSQGNINSMKNTGGLIGNLRNSLIENCYTKGTIKGSENVGGIVGYSINSTINNCYSSASVRITYEQILGPITGDKENSIISRCYSIGSAYDSKRDHIFGISGTDCFWLQWYWIPLECTQLSYGDNVRTAIEMKNPNIYIENGWDFVNETENGTDDVWDIDTSGVINDGYPFLHWEHPETTYFTSISDIQIPDCYCLHQNYPNPFNPLTMIGYDIKEASHARLDIYNISGQLLETLADKYHQAGTYKVKWDASRYSSGVYIYTLRYSDKQLSRKMLLIK